MPTQKYRNDSRRFWKSHIEGDLDYSSYKTQLDKLLIEEVERRRRNGSVLTAAQIENEVFEYEENCRIQRGQEEDEERINKLPPRERYKAKDVPETIVKYRKESNYYRRIHNFFQGIIIIGSILVTGVIGFGDVPKWVPVIISTLIGVSAGFTGYYKFRERSFNLQQTADAIEQEYKAVGLGIGVYKDQQAKDALVLFAERVEFMLEEQKKRQQQLEQPPDTKLTKTE